MPGHANNNNNIPTTKLVILALLGFCAVILGSAVLTMQVHVLSLRHEIQLQQEQQRSGGQDDRKSSSASGGDNTYDSEEISTTVQSSEHTPINLARQYPPPDPTSFKMIGGTYWNRVAQALKNWDVMTSTSDMPKIAASYTAETGGLKMNSTTANYEPNEEAVFALEQAAKSGNPEAQHLYANALASGIWPFNNANLDRSKATRHLQVTDEWISTSPRNQLHESYLNWHMAAMGGNVEAAMALASRKNLEGTSLGGSTSSNKMNPLDHCKESLPYYEAAANGIMDMLEHDPNNRAKVLPPMDKHILSQVHIHGGTSSQLDWNNKPDESEEALQFYHLKATTSWKNPPKKSRKSSKDKNSKDANKNIEKKKEDHNIDINAAYTLGHLYHYGVRGVPQNLTSSLQYYEIAAVHGHWESAGHAGTMYFWGMGTEQDIETAWDYFKLGAPFGLEGCRRKHDNALKLQQKKAQKVADEEDDDQEANVSECDDNAVNGLGLVHLFGIEGYVEVDVVEAEKYFVLAKEMGNADAMYNLAMMWLGWKTHYKNVEDLADGGMSFTSHTFADETPGMAGGPIGGSTSGGDNKNVKDYALHKSRNTGQTFKGPLQSDITDALKLLSVASSKGHLQAKHRLGLIYSQGVKIQTSALLIDAIKPDCNKAKTFYNYLIENSAPSRSKRLRKAYKDYIAGDLESSLRNYLAAGETGSSIGQVNAAFLLERGTCLGLSPKDCAKASVRLWKAAAAKGDVEAYLRVGDFYYYGRLRGKTLPTGPFAWVQYVLYPEEFLPTLMAEAWEKIQAWYIGDGVEDEETTDTSRKQNKGKLTIRGDKPATEHEDVEEIVDSDLAMAAHYYQVAVEKYSNSRANFNLGFMHEWGLGITQDFPLAKRHYDLAASGHTKEAELAVQIALVLMNAHERIVKWHLAFTEWWDMKHTEKDSFQDGGGDDDEPQYKRTPRPAQR